MISVNNLVKSYSGNLAVDDLSFEVVQGSIYGLLGPNGAGKSTTMNILTGYISATSGKVTIDGVDILEEPEKAKSKIGYLPELPPVYPDMTVREYLKFVCDLKKIPKAKINSTIENVLDITSTKDVQTRLIKNLSKGYRQRVGLAQALLGDPKVIILDEPTVGLDPKQIIEIRELIKSLGAKHTVILSSHILSEVSEICDHILIISSGKLVANGTAEEIAASIHKKSKLTVTVKADVAKVKGILSDITDIESFECSTDSDGTVIFTITATDDKDIREPISIALASAGCLILGMQHESMSLEDVFLELTDSNSKNSVNTADTPSTNDKEAVR